MSAYYNEIDPFAAQWLRNLISAGRIAPGDVDERSIVDVRASDLAGYTQCHFFAGIGGWSLALRLAGWPDDRPVWTGSCPCPPFSQAGKGSECPSCGGKSCLAHPLVTAGWLCLSCGDEWRGDDRHLLPELIRLIGQCRPPVFFGEQVASPDGRLWLHAFRAVMERARYAFGAADLPAAGVGAPHIRQRLGFVADTTGEQLTRWQSRSSAQPQSALGGHDSLGFVADADDARSQGWGERGDGADQRPSRSGGVAGGLADTAEPGRDAQPLGTNRAHGRSAPESGRLRDAGSGSGPLHVDWRDADWLLCRDGKWRPAEPGSQPLAHGVPGRVGRLRAYGNAIVPALWAELIGAYLDLEQARAA